MAWFPQMIIGNTFGFLMGITSPASMQGLLKKEPSRFQTHVTLHVGLAVSQLGLGGDMPDETYNHLGQSLTQKTRHKDKTRQGEYWIYDLAPHDGKFKGEGNSKELEPWLEGSNAQPTYLSIRHWGDDAVCIAAIAVAGPDGVEYHISGDAMSHCNWPSYPSTKFLSLGGYEHTPRCFWLGGKDHDLYNNPQMVWIHLRDFHASNKTVAAYNDDWNKLCSSEPRLHRMHGGPDKFMPLVFHPPMTYPENATATDNGTFRGVKATAYDPQTLFNATMWKYAQVSVDTNRNPEKILELRNVSLAGDLLFYQTRIRPGEKQGNWPPPANRPAERASSSKRSASRFSGMWSHSNSTEHRLSATVMCEVPSMVGPDYANSHERKYCKMTSRELIPFCDTDDQVNCFDFEVGQERLDSGFDHVSMSAKLAGSGVGLNPRVRLEIGAHAM